MIGKPGDKMRKICFIIVFLLILFSFLSSGCITEEKESGKDSSNIDEEINDNATTMQNFLDDMTEENGNQIFISYDEGDEVEIIDTITQIVYHSDDNETYILFKSQESNPLGNYFKRDLTSKFSVNDKVIITFHIIKIDMGNGHFIEYPEEGYNSETGNSEPFDSDCIELSE